MPDTNKIMPFGEEQSLSHSRNRQKHFLSYEEENDKKLSENLVDNYVKAFAISEKFKYESIYDGIGIAAEYTEKAKELKLDKEENILEFLKHAKKMTNENLTEIFKNKPISYKYSGVLYPPALLYLYESTKYQIFISFIEDKCNRLLEQFISGLKGQVLASYKNRLIESLNDMAKYVGNGRALVATFNKSQNPADNINENCRKEFAENLGASESISYEEALDLLDQITKRADSEEQILGRILYIMIWYSIEKPKTDYKLFE